MCPCRKVDPKYNSIKDISDLPLSTREKIQYFFSHYKDLENKHVTVGNWLDKNDAINIYLHSMNNISID
jgi:inorganic pyrophosphatase